MSREMDFPRHGYLVGDTCFSDIFHGSHGQ